MSIFKHRDSDSDVFGSKQMREPAKIVTFTE